MTRAPEIVQVYYQYNVIHGNYVILFVVPPSSI